MAWEEWEQCEQLSGSLTLIELENEDAGEEMTYNIKCENQLPEPITLNEGTWYTDFHYGVVHQYTNLHRIKVEVGKYSISDYMFTILP